MKSGRQMKILPSPQRRLATGSIRTRGRGAPSDRGAEGRVARNQGLAVARQEVQGGAEEELRVRGQLARNADSRGGVLPSPPFLMRIPTMSPGRTKMMVPGGPR
jgi:hypothetical protein